MNYSESAVNLTNAEEIKAKLVDLEGYQINLAVAQADAEQCIPEDIKKRIADNALVVGSLKEEIRALIDLLGSYQDMEAGRYAVKQRRVSVSYDAIKFEAAFPLLSPAVIVKTVNPAALKGLIKGGLVSETELSIKQVSQESESFAYIIKVPGQPVGSGVNKIESKPPSVLP